MRIIKHSGVAGQVQYTALYDDGGVSFVGSVYGGPVVMVSEDGRQTFVTNPSRFGEFGEEWVRRFLSPDPR